MENDKSKTNNTEEMKSYENEFQTSIKKYEKIEMKIFHVNKKKERIFLELEEMKMRNEMLKERLINIHDNYLSCLTILNNQQRYENEIRETFEKLTIERDDLKKRLIEYKQLKEDNKEKIEKLSLQVEIEKKKHVALIRKLERTSKMENISEGLRNKINVILTKNKSLNKI